MNKVYSIVILVIGIGGLSLIPKLLKGHGTSRHLRRGKKHNFIGTTSPDNATFRSRINLFLVLITGFIFVIIGVVTLFGQHSQ